MNNKKYYPFKRNNYFYGKLLTVRDFEEEQRYFNDKRRLNNFLVSGAGVVSGLNVVCIDEKTVSIESGMALDYLGREIIVEEPVINKLNVIDGFEYISDYGRAYLCIEYMESYEEKVPSVTGGADSDNFYNRIKEGYHLFITGSVEDKRLLTKDYLFEDRQVIYSDENITIEQSVPLMAGRGEKVAIDVYIEKKNLPKIIEVDYNINLNCLKSEDGKNTIRVYYRDLDIKENKKTRITVYAVSDDVEEEKGIIEIIGGGSVTVGSSVYNMEKTAVFKMDITNKSFALGAVEKYMDRHFDDVVTIGSENCIYLCSMNIIKNGGEYLIEDFEPMPFNQYLPSNTMLMAIINHEAKRAGSNLERIPLDASYLQEESRSSINISDYVSSGEEIIEIDILSKNKSYFSEEIAHGLGKGNVMVNAALVEDDEEGGIFSIKKNFAGDMSVFEGTDFEPDLSGTKIGVIIYPERGTFRIGLKFLKDANVPAVKVNWWTVKTGSGSNADISEVSGVTIRIDPNTITIGTREKYKFEAIISGTVSRECRWSVKDRDGGIIDANGVYMSPSQEGVYEVVVGMVKYPDIKASAFVVVKEM